VARVAFHLRLRPERLQDYDEAHQRVPLELRALLKNVGICRYSIFRRGADLFLYMHVDDFEHAWSVIDTDPVNQRWQRQMSSLFEPTADLQPGERFPMMREVFHLE
jgi:L-rhamnose mutarotase